MYEPNPFDGPPEQVASYLVQELYRISDALKNIQVDQMEFNVRSNPPDKPRNGQLYSADGDNWDPGYGKGLYYYTDGEYFPLITPPKVEKIFKSSLRLVSFAPVFTNSTKIFTPSFKGLRLSSYAPLMTNTSQQFFPSKGSLTFTTYAPGVT